MNNTVNIKLILNSKSLRLFLIGNCVSIIGSLITQTARSWLVYNLTGSAAWLGGIMFADQFSTFILLPFAGVFADRWNRYRSILSTQILSMLVSFTTALLVLTGRIQPWELLMLTFLQGCINAFDLTIRQTFLTQLVKQPEYIGQVVSINTSIFGAARMIAPAIAGLLIAQVGAGVCFAADGVSFIVLLFALISIKLPKQRPQLKEAEPFLHGLQEGFSYVVENFQIRMIIILLAIVSLVAISSITTLLPVFATDILKGDSSTLGFLSTASGMGSLLAVVYVTTQTSLIRLSCLIAIAPFISGAAVAVFGVSHNFWISLTAAFLIGFGVLLQHSTGNTLIQTLVREEMRGRVSSIYIMAFNGMSTIGSLSSGLLSSQIGVVKTVLASGVLCLGTAIWFNSQLPALQQRIKR
ncbi:MAG: MFS transporter [Rivularia sp. (in: cyanobacteria)]